MSATTPPQAIGLPGRNGAHHPAPTRQRAVLLLNLGTPDDPTVPAVRRYLTEFLSDPEVIRLPRRLRWLNWPLARMIAQFRSPKSAHAYRTIWTDAGSPLKTITEDQVDALQSCLPKGWSVYYAMRYGNPTVASTLDAIIADGIQDLVVVPMYPQFSGPTTGTAVDDFYRHLRQRGQRLGVTIRNHWHDDVGYIDAQARLIQQQAEEHDLHPGNCMLMFSTHSMPESYIRDGDPYQGQVLETVKLVTERLGWRDDRTVVAYQSKLGPVPWLSPSTEETLQKLAKDGEPNVLVCPVSFTADCLETLEEIGITYREEFEAGGGRMHLCSSLNTFKPFIKALSQLAMRGTKPVSECRVEQPPLMQFDEVLPSGEDLDVAGLVMVGVSMLPKLESDLEPGLKHVSPEEFQCVKKPHHEVTALLKRVQEAGGFRECWLWNTCSRFEFYGWLTKDPKSSEADQAVARAVTEVIGANADGFPMNVLQGSDALRHLLRTAAGLNSGLPGDTEVVNQMEVAQRIAARSGTAGPLTERLLHEVMDSQGDLREQTAWGKFRPEYCHIALKRVAVTGHLDWRGKRCVVVGGSVTARSIIRVLREQFGVSANLITAVHRTHSKGTQLKRLREAIGGGTRLRVDHYSDARVLEAIAEADVVFYGVDAREPVHDRAQLLDDRDLASHPLTIVDFNTFGSTDELDGAAGVEVFDAERLDREVKTYAEGLCECPAFTAAASQADHWIASHLLDGAAERHASGSDCGCANASAPVLMSCPCTSEGVPPLCPKKLMAERTVE